MLRDDNIAQNFDTIVDNIERRKPTLPSGASRKRRRLDGGDDGGPSPLRKPKPARPLPKPRTPSPSIEPPSSDEGLDNGIGRKIIDEVRSRQLVNEAIENDLEVQDVEMGRYHNEIRTDITGEAIAADIMGMLKPTDIEKNPGAPIGKRFKVMFKGF